MNCAENPFKMGMFLQLEVSFKMGAFSDTQHTHPGIFILESPPWAICRMSWYGWLWVDVDYMKDVVVWVAMG